MTPRLVLRPYQVEMADAMQRHLKTGGRGQIRAACGSGKTAVALTAVQRLCPKRGAIAVLLFPSLALIRQTLLFFTEQGLAFEPLAVCSDKDVVDSTVDVADIPSLVSTDPMEIAAWLTVRRERLRLIVGTYQSVGRLVSAMRETGTRAHLLICDEAHHTAGLKSKRAALVHDDLPAVRRLYLTATAKVSGRGGETILSMDDEDVFGPVLYTYPFARGIAEGYLDDFRVVVLAVSRPEIRSMLQRLATKQDSASRGGPARVADGQLLLAQVALAKAASRWNLRRVIAFCPLVREAHQLAATLPATLQRLPRRDRPAIPLTAHAVDSRVPLAVRAEYLADLAHPPDGGWTVLSNARCLGEGVDVPTVDAVLFTAPKKSEIDVVQAVGRALRRSHDGSGTSTIVVPLLLPEDADDLAAHSDAAYDTVWQVLDALRAHDDALAHQLNEASARLSAISGGSGGGKVARSSADALPPRVALALPPGWDHEEVFSHVAVRMIRGITSSWWASYGNVRAYAEREGHLQAPGDYVENGTPVREWLGAQRSLRRGGKLTVEQVEALDKIGIVWEPRLESFQAGVAAYVAFRKREGDRAIPRDHLENGIKLFFWLSNLRASYKGGTLAAEHIEAARAAGIVFDAFEERFQLGLAACRRFQERFGHLDVVATYVDGEGFPLGVWLCTKRREFKNQKLDPRRVAALAKAGIRLDVDPREEAFQRRLEALRRFKKRTGHVKATRSDMQDGVPLGEWLTTLRGQARRGKLAPHRRVQLVKLGVRLD